MYKKADNTDFFFYIIKHTAEEEYSFDDSTQTETPDSTPILSTSAATLPKPKRKREWEDILNALDNALAYWIKCLNCIQSEDINDIFGK